MVLENYTKIVLKIAAPPNDPIYNVNQIKFFYELKIKAIRLSENHPDLEPQSAI